VTAPPSSGGHPARFSNELARFAFVVAGFWFAIIGLAELTAGHSIDAGQRISGACLTGAGLWFAWRGNRSTTVIVGDERVILRSLIKTRSYAVGDLLGARVEIGRTGPNGFGREYLVLECRDGSTVPFKELNARPSKTQPEESVVQEAASTIRQRVGDSGLALG
jgi:hypothetical protein